MSQNKKKNITAKIIASIALIGIFIGIVGTSILFIVSTFTPQRKEASEQELQNLMKTMSGSEVSSSGPEVSSGEILEKSEQ